MQGQETVILVHGLWVHGIVMMLMRRRVARCGYRTFTYSYPTMRLTLTENAARLAAYCRGLAASRLHFVGHSLGGLLVLRMLECAPDIEPGCIVLAGTPFADTFAGRRLARLPGGKLALGKSLAEWLHGEKRLRPGCEVGVIAGDLGIGLGRIVAPDMQGPNDGVVRVEETRVPGMRDHVVLNVNHTGMLLSKEVTRRICEFLRHGAFAPAARTGGRKA
jgi:hypothetical protein